MSSTHGFGVRRRTNQAGCPSAADRYVESLARASLMLAFVAYAACSGVRPDPTVVPPAGAASTPTIAEPPAVAVVHASRAPIPPRSPMAREAVSRFLRLANRRELTAMGMAFGTDQGPLLEWASDAAEVEVRMEAIASILRHDTYRIKGEERVAGSGGRAVRILVDLTTHGRTVPLVPFVAVRITGGGWLVREVDLAKVMAGR